MPKIKVLEYCEFVVTPFAQQFEMFVQLKNAIWTTQFIPKTIKKNLYTKRKI